MHVYINMVYVPMVSQISNCFIQIFEITTIILYIGTLIMNLLSFYEYLISTLVAIELYTLTTGKDCIPCDLCIRIISVFHPVVQMHPHCWTTSAYMGGARYHGGRP